ncbi:ABC-F family ATP-binding cassette domain-containing protein [Solicola sp. PLA-1-18]|uniref:ABC-F family ATP-binding cassette domain-containing protein n=1 Tax=Solicola sp. PLA-1-18 TaxID=3380532 RepID=UPI003B7E430A
MAAPVNLVNLESVHKSYGIRPLLDGVSLGVASGDRIGVVGRNGGGKSTLLRVLSRVEEPDSGRVTHSRGLEVGFLTQTDHTGDARTIRDAVLDGAADHTWAADPRTRDVVRVLLAGVPIDRDLAGLSGGERRRVSLARLLLSDAPLVVLDEPTNHLDIDAIAWLADHLAKRPGALLVVTHDRWFLDAVCTRTWEVHDGVVDAFEGGYAAYVLAKAERDRQAASRESRRRNLARKELAWLRRGPPARTSKPQFRIDAAQALIADEPPPRDRLELEKFATARLGKDVLDVEDVTLVRGGKTLLDDVTWRLGPGDRVGLVGANGSGKSSLVRLLAGESEPDAGRVKRGKTVDLAHLTQTLDDMDGDDRVIDSVRADELTATGLLEGFGFTGDLLTSRVRELSGGERRRLQVLRMLLSEPNVLLLDEPTNDLDIETLTVLEDHLDRWPGTLVVVSHDRYFLERVTDTVWALPGDASLKMLVGGVESYHPSTPGSSGRAPVPGPTGGSTPEPSGVSAADRRSARKDVARLERQMERLAMRERDLEEQMATDAADPARLTALQQDWQTTRDERESLELEWLSAAELAE